MKKIFLICAAVISLSMGVMLALNPPLADIISEENNLLENLTVGVCAVALVISLNLFFKNLKNKSGHGFWLFLSAFLIIFIGDEISWGINFFHITKPRIGGVGLDGLHDVLSISIGIIKQVRDYIISIGISDIKAISIIAGTAAAIIALLSILIKGIAKNKEKIKIFFSNNLKREPFLFLFIGIILLVAMMVVDDDNLVGFPHKAAVEEPMELLAAVSLLFSSISGLRRK